MADLSHWIITFGTTTYSEGTTQGQAIGAVRNDTLATLASVDNEIAPLQVNASGALYIQEGAALDVSAATVTVDLGANNDVINAGTFAVQEDGAALTALQKLDNIAHSGSDVALVEHVPISGQLDDTATTTVTENQIAPVRITSGRALHVATQGTTTVSATDLDIRALVNTDVVTAELSATDNAVLDNIDTNTTNIPNVIGTDGAAGPTNAISIGGTESGGNLQELRVDADGHLQIDVLSGGGGGTQYTLGTDTYTETTTIGTVAGAVRNDTLATLVNTDNEITALQVNASGALYIQEGSALDVSAATVTVDLGANNDVTTEFTGSTAVAAMADDDANPTVLPVGGYMMGYDSGATNWNRVEVDDAGHLQVDVLSGGGSDTPTNPVNDYATVASLAAGSSTTTELTTPEAGSKKLAKVEVWSSVAFKAFLHTVDDGTQSTDPVAVGGGASYQSWQWEPPHRNYVTLSANAGLDAFRIIATNLDDSLAADVYCTFHYED